MTPNEIIKKLELVASMPMTVASKSISEFCLLAIAELRSLEADAARWRYFEKNGERMLYDDECEHWYFRGEWYPSVRAAIDAAMAKGVGK